MPRDLRTTQPLWFPTHSTAPEHLERVVGGVVVLGPTNAQPSRLATELVARVTILYATATDQTAPRPVDPIVQAAADEAVAMLGAYIARLENLARDYGEHLNTYTCTRS